MEMAKAPVKRIEGDACGTQNTASQTPCKTG